MRPWMAAALAVSLLLVSGAASAAEFHSSPIQLARGGGGGGGDGGSCSATCKQSWKQCFRNVCLSNAGYKDPNKRPLVEKQARIQCQSEWVKFEACKRHCGSANLGSTVIAGLAMPPDAAPLCQAN